jgi:hypothetical protein
MLQHVRPAEAHQGLPTGCGMKGFGSSFLFNEAFFFIFSFILQHACSYVLSLLLSQIALQGIGGVNTQHLEFLIKHERLLAILRRDVFCKPFIHQQRKMSCEIIRLMIEHCTHEAGTRLVVSLFRFGQKSHVTRQTSHVTRHTSQGIVGT